MALMLSGSGRPWAAARKRHNVPVERDHTASRFQQKLWSIFRFARPFMAKTDGKPGQVDRWLLTELDRLVLAATSFMDNFQFDETIKAIRAFAWETLADNYIELVKARLYGPDCAEKRAAQNTALH